MSDKQSNILAELASDDSRLVKESIILREATSGNDAFFHGLRMALDPMTTFGLKQIPHSSGGGAGITEIQFNAVAEKLMTRELSGNAARDAVNTLMLSATATEWDGWYKRILLKDLKAGFSEATVNKVVDKKFQQYTIPVFTVQLAKDCVDEDGNVDESELVGVKGISVKLDGMRCMSVVYPDGRVQQYTRNGKELVNFTKITSQLASVASTFDEPMVLDGEVMGASFQDLMKQSRRKTDIQADDSVLNLFDIIPLSEFLKGIGKQTQRQRTADLDNWFSTVETLLPNVTVVGHEDIDLRTEAGRTRLAEINAIALAGGYEGIMLKDLDAVYECKRSVNWLKMKPFLEESLTVVGVEAGKPNSKFAGTMGALVCEDIIDGKKVRVNVGGGFSVQQRAQIWADHTRLPVTWQKKVEKKWVTMTENPSSSSVVGMVAEIRADALTKPQTGDVWSMRFPRFKTWRGFAAGEKL